MFRGPIPDLLKSFMSDTNGKSIFDVKSLSRDLMRGFLDKAIQQKDVLVSVLASEVKNFLSKVDLAEELRKTLKGMSISVHFDFDHKKSPTVKVKRKKSKRS